MQILHIIFSKTQTHHHLKTTNFYPIINLIHFCYRSLQ